MTLLRNRGADRPLHMDESECLLALDVLDGLRIERRDVIRASGHFDRCALCAGGLESLRSLWDGDVMAKRNSDDYIRNLVRKITAGDLDELPRLVRAWERTRDGKPSFDLRAEVRRLVDESQRRDGTDMDAAIRDVLTELMHLADENGIDIQDRLDAAIAVAREEQEQAQLEREGPYTIGDVFFPGMECDERRSSGRIVIGGDRGDVHATGAWSAEDGENDEEGVMLENAVLHTSIAGLTDEEALGIIRDVVTESWEAVGKDTFTVSKR